MRIQIITPAPPGTQHGNRVTAIRWARILRKLGHHVMLAQSYQGTPVDLLLALHAKRSYPAIRRFHRLHPDRPLIVALTGTDVYRDLRKSRRAQTSLDLATRLVVLQPKALDEIRPRLRDKAAVIFQSARPAPRNCPRPLAARNARSFDVCVVGHLRPVKDPFRAALAARLLPPDSCIRILHFGAALSAGMANFARAEMERNSRYHWRGERPRWNLQRILARSRLCVLSSKLEGGANLLSEAIVNRVPVLASRIPGSVGILGEDYPGYFRVGDTGQLAQLLERAENDRAFLRLLRSRCARRLALFQPAREKAAWRKLLNDLRVA
ncbi:MAG TPA: selenoneine biosynthesis selenosugar synthase SenB [Terriglobia bacterium]|nr:selenoneine biosynthesis selenosugar synthase SenB [Terriglobia bacterium]